MVSASGFCQSKVRGFREVNMEISSPVRAGMIGDVLGYLNQRVKDPNRHVADDRNDRNDGSG
jgi:hypothetical protein